jgi:hypothetical protein
LTGASSEDEKKVECMAQMDMAVKPRGLFGEVEEKEDEEITSKQNLVSVNVSKESTSKLLEVVKENVLLKGHDAKSDKNKIVSRKRKAESKDEKEEKIMAQTQRSIKLLICDSKFDYLLSSSSSL